MKESSGVLVLFRREVESKTGKEEQRKYMKAEIEWKNNRGREGGRGRKGERGREREAGWERERETE